jgi:hypothetical protein
MGRSRNLLDPISRQETIASPLQGRDVSRTILSITKRPAQADDVKPKLPPSAVTSGQTRASRSFSLTTSFGRHQLN